MGDNNNININMEEEEKKNINFMCGSKTSPYLIKYVITVLFSLIVLIFSIIQIGLNKNDNTIYFSLISSIIAIYIPAPSHTKN